MRTLADRIKRELLQREHCAIYEDELSRVWPLSDQEREAKIAEFARRYGFRVGHYSKGLCAIFVRED